MGLGVKVVRSYVSQEWIRFSRRISNGALGNSNGVPPGNSPTTVFWDTSNRIRVIGATLGVIGAACMLFDTFYRRATKQELKIEMDKLDTKIDREMDKLSVKIIKDMDKIDSKIDRIINELWQSNQLEKIAVETENRALKREIERSRETDEET
jgi:hypothetical protein